MRAALSATRAATDQERPAVFAALDRAFSRWVGGHLEHMVREEEEGLPSLRRHFDDDRIAAMRRDIQVATPKDHLDEWFRRLMRALSTPEIVGVLRGAKTGAPAPVFAGMVGVAEEELGPRFLEVKTRAEIESTT